MVNMEKLHEAAHRTWRVIGGDCLRSLEEETGETTMPREEVVEAVIDYIGDYMEPGQEEFKQLKYEEKKRLITKCFTFTSYSL